MTRGRAVVIAALVMALGCDGETPPDDAGADRPDSGPVEPASVAHCTFTEVAPTGGAGGTVEAGALTAGVAERMLDLPLGASLAAYTARAEGAGRGGFLPEPDARRTYLAGSFAPSIGIETAPRARALALSAGGETVLLLKLDLATSYQGFVHDVEARLGPEYSGKVIVASSHSHSSFGNYSGHSALAVGFGRWRSTVYDRILDQLVEVAEAAIADLQPAQIGFSYDGEFDREDLVNRDRRGENDDLAGGHFDDHHLYVIRVDTMGGEPMAVVPVFGIHGTLQGEKNAFICTDSIGGIERVLEESFDSEVLVMHLQGAGGDVSPAGRGAIECGDAEVCSDFAKDETVGIFARDAIVAAWEAAGAAMLDTLEIEMVTRTVPLGPDWETFVIRDGELRYAPFDLDRDADGIVYEDGVLVSPIDEFNAPFGAALCSPTRPAIIPRAQMPGTQGSEYTYRGCNRLEMVDRIFELSIDVDFEEPPICETTQTTVTALRLGEWMLGTLPGEPMTLLAEHLRTLSPVPPERTIVVGYAQDHGGYLLRPEDWLSGGYEPEITFWGPLEGEYVAEQTARLFALAATPEREDGNAEGIARVASPTLVDEITEDDAQDVGTVPDTLPAYILTRLLRPVSAAQPPAQIERMQNVFFTWIGDDPLRGTARPILQREVSDGVWEDVARRSGRVVQDGDVIMSWTPDPISRVAGEPRTHYYTAEFQAVSPMGMPGLDAIADRGGLPLGRYRFRILAPTYELTSDPFEVVPATLLAETEAMGSDLRVTLGFENPEGFRLLDLEARSNQRVPLRSQDVEVTVGGGAAMSLTTAADGSVTVPGGASAEVAITDRFGNGATIAP